MHYLLVLIAGSAIHLSFSPYNFWLAGLAGLLVFTAIIATASQTKKIFWLAFIFGIGLFGTGVNWVYVSIHTYGEVPMPLAVIFTGGFAIFLALMFALPWLLFQPLANSRRLKLICFPAFWLLSEWLRGWLLTGFPWLYLGYAHTDGPLIGWIPLVGVMGTSVLLAMACCALIYLIDKRTLKSLLIFSIFSGLIFGGGLMMSNLQWTQQEPTNIPVTLVQPDIPLRDKWNPARADGILEILETQSSGAWQPGLLVWPEAAIPYSGLSAEPYVDFLDTLGNASGAAIITGLLTYNLEKQRYLNSIAGLGAADSSYHKQRLVPFGEYVPLEQLLRGTMHFFDLPMSIISAGSKGQAPLNFNYAGDQYLLAPALCYEIAYSGLVRDISRDAHILITLSNDAWFGTSIGPWQHMQIAQARALENQKPLIRVTNNGISAMVDYRGQIYDALPQFQQARLTSFVQARTGNTPYNSLGNWPLGILSLMITIFCAYRSLIRRRFLAKVV